MLGAMNPEGNRMPVKFDRFRLRFAMVSGLCVALPAAAIVSAPAPSTAQESSASAAHSNQPMKLLKLSVSGNGRVPTADIDSAMTVRVGQKVTRADLQANLNAIVDVYRKANVGARCRLRLTIPRPGQASVAYMIEEQAAPVARASAVLRLDRVTFEGNKQIKSNIIGSAITLKPGDAVDDAEVRASQQAIMALYKKAGIGVKITPGASYPQPNHAIVDYRIEEQAGG
jgi:outer membrane protein assembly factor BamA